VTTFIVNDGSRLFLTNLQSRCRAAELWCCGEVSSSARGDDDRHARREEQRASGLAKVVKSNLGKPGLSSGRGRGRCGGQPFAAVASMPAGRYSRVVGGRVRSSLSARAGRLRRRRLLTCVNANADRVRTSQLLLTSDSFSRSEVSYHSAASVQSLRISWIGCWRDSCLDGVHARHRKAVRVHPAQRQPSRPALRRHHQQRRDQAGVAQQRSFRPDSLSSSMVAGRRYRVPR
jgi:hypothetical protein